VSDQEQELEAGLADLANKFGLKAVAAAARRMARRTNRKRGAPQRYVGDIAGVYAYVEAHRDGKTSGGKRRGIGGACKQLIKCLGPYVDPDVESDHLEKLYRQGVDYARNDERFRSEIAPWIEHLKRNPSWVVLLSRRNKAGGATIRIDTKPETNAEVIEFDEVQLKWAPRFPKAEWFQPASIDGRPIIDPITVIVLARFRAQAVRAAGS
jgi:hypothetical protein